MFKKYSLLIVLIFVITSCDNNKTDITLTVKNKYESGHAKIATFHQEKTGYKDCMLLLREWEKDGYSGTCQ